MNFGMCKLILLMCSWLLPTKPCQITVSHAGWNTVAIDNNKFNDAMIGRREFQNSHGLAVTF
jgi:hypothetical protein